MSELGAPPARRTADPLGLAPILSALPFGGGVQVANCLCPSVGKVDYAVAIPVRNEAALLPRWNGQLYALLGDAAGGG